MYSLTCGKKWSLQTKLAICTTRIIFIINVIQDHYYYRYCGKCNHVIEKNAETSIYVIEKK